MSQLRELRESIGITLKGAADAIDYDISNLSKVERGLASLSIPVALRLADLYCVTVEEVIIGAGYQYPSRQVENVNDILA